MLSKNGSFGVSSTCRVKHDLRHYQSFPDPFRTNTRFRAFQSENLIVVPEAERQRLIERRDKALVALASKGGEDCIRKKDCFCPVPVPKPTHPRQTVNQSGTEATLPVAAPQLFARSACAETEAAVLRASPRHF